MERLERWTSISAQVTVGLVAVVVSITSALGWPSGTTERTLLLWAVGVLGLICLAIGLERWRVLYQLQDQLTGVQNLFSENTDVQLLDGEKVITAHTLSSALSSSDNLVSFLVGTGQSQPEAWFDDVLNHLKHLVRMGRSPNWTVYVLYDWGGPRPEFRNRFDKVAKAGLGGRIQVKAIDYRAPAGYEFFIVDDARVYLNLPSAPGETDRKVRALYFHDAPSIATQLKNWATALDSVPYEASQ